MYKYKGHSYITLGPKLQPMSLIPARFWEITLLTKKEYENLREKRTYPCSGRELFQEMFRAITESDLYTLNLAKF